MEKATVVAMKGHPATGKSTLARSLSARLRWTLLDKDDVKDQTFFLTKRYSVPEPELNEACYKVLWQMTDTQLSCGSSVIIDSPLSRAELFLTLSEICRRHGAHLRVIECRADAAPALWKHRLECRERGRDSCVKSESHKPSTWNELQTLIRSYGGSCAYPMPMTPLLVVDFTAAGADADAIASHAVDWIRCGDEPPLVRCLPFSLLHSLDC